MNSRVELDNKSAVVLHHYNYRDSSLIVNFFLSDSGLVSAIAKGVKAKKSRQNQATLIQPFQTLKVSLIGKGELLILKNIELETKSLSASWSLSGKSLYCAYYLNELLLKLLPSNMDCQSIFSLYTHILTVLAETTDQTSEHYEVPLRLFELKLLEYLGYGLNLSHDINSNLPIESNKQYTYIIDAGPTEIPQEGESSFVLSGKTLLDLNDGQLSDKKTLQESKQLLKWALTQHLGNKPLKSREMFKQLYCFK